MSSAPRPRYCNTPMGVLPQRHIAALEDTAKTHQVSLFVNGVDPGFANDLIPLVFASTCQHVEQIRCTEVADYASYNGATVMFDVWVSTPTRCRPPLLRPGVLSMAWGSAIRAMGAGLRIEVDEITDTCELDWASEEFDVSPGRIPRGGVAAMRFEICGWSRGKRALVIEHVTRLRPDQRPDGPQPAQEGGSDRVEIIGEPSLWSTLSNQRAGRPQLCGDRRGCRADRQRDSRGRRRGARPAHRT